MLSVRVPLGTRSGRVSFAGVLGNAARAEFTSPPPFTPNFPASAGSAKTARIPLPPFWLRSSPLPTAMRSEEHTSELQSRPHLVCRLLLEKKKKGISKLATGGSSHLPRGCLLSKLLC